MQDFRFDDFKHTCGPRNQHCRLGVGGKQDQVTQLPQTTRIHHPGVNDSKLEIISLSARRECGYMTSSYERRWRFAGIYSRHLSRIYDTRENDGTVIIHVDIG